MERVARERFGRDHWSVLAYIETRCVDYKGTIERSHMRCNVRTHPALATQFSDGEHGRYFRQDKYRYPTKLIDGTTVDGHDDYDCFYDLEAAGLLKDLGTGVNPLAELTSEGKVVVERIRSHKADGGSFATFKDVTP